MGDVMKPAMMHDSISTLQNNFTELGINKEPSAVSVHHINIYFLLYMNLL